MPLIKIKERAHRMIYFQAQRNTNESAFMNLSYRKSQCQQHLGKRLGVRWLLSILVVVAIFLGQSAPSMAGHSANSASGWIEICGDGGSYFAQVDTGDGGQAPECAHCDFCLVPTGDTPNVHLAAQNATVSTDFAIISYFNERAILPDSPEQYWSACRGPPIASIENNMTTLASLSNKEPAVKVLNTWSNPCL